MTGTVELDQDGAHLLIRFPYREDLVAMVKELPGRRWDPRGKVWRVPATHVEAVYAACSRHLFEFAPEIPSLLAGTLQPAKIETKAPSRPRPPLPEHGQQGQLGLPLAAPTSAGQSADPSASEAPQAWTVSQLNERVRDGLRLVFPDALWVIGEIVDFDKTADRQHHFFQLVEKSEGLARPRAVVEVALFASTAERLLPTLARGEPALTLRDGIEIRALVKVDFYPASGRFQLIVQDIDPSFTLGKLALSREQVLRELAQRGLAQRNRSLGLPLPTLRIGVLTSPDADGWNDFLRHLEESGCGFDVTLFPIRVQGVELKPTLLRGLAWFAARQQDFDCLCIVRGGGSRTDLAWFDDRDVALAVAQHPLKVLVGIGHQRDQSVLDLIAHSEKTPTAVAAFLVRGLEGAREELTERAMRLADAAADLLADERRRLVTAARAVVQASHRALADARRDLGDAAQRLGTNVTVRLLRERNELRRSADRVANSARRQLEKQQGLLERAAVRHRLLDPRRVLQRGFAIVRGADGRVAPSVARLADGEAVRVQFRDGHAEVRVQTTQREDAPEA
ncbi:MAG: exodeoxyribonuclease VII large subunit [Planctomycetes bacterium]|nr:exodeoxyribonuclease VII large subunit [Planctomycetota bacterium]